MPRSERYDHVISEEFDDYESRRRCAVCRVERREPPRLSPTRCRHSTDANVGRTANAFTRTLFALAVVLVVGGVVYGVWGLYCIWISELAVPAAPSRCSQQPRNAAAPSAIWPDDRPRDKCRPCVHFRRERARRRDLQRSSTRWPRPRILRHLTTADSIPISARYGRAIIDTRVLRSTTDRVHW